MGQREYQTALQNWNGFHLFSTHSANKARVRNGLVFIPDISGFTELVHSTDVITGKQITYELLSAVIDQNNLDLEIAEIEGDAVLFYRYATSPSISELIKQYYKMVKAFEIKRRQLENRFSQNLDLSLKVIAHYGPITEFNIGGFKKLYGEVVVVAHKLLKNSVDSNSYILLTDSLLQVAGNVDQDKLLSYGVRSNKLCELYGGFRNICFTYLDFTEEQTWKQAA
jgi:hypothetical protein